MPGCGGLSFWRRLACCSVSAQGRCPSPRLPRRRTCAWTMSARRWARRPCRILAGSTTTPTPMKFRQATNPRRHQCGGSYANFGDVWDSGQVAGSSENHVVYAGAPLTSDTQYYWKVRTWNREGNAGPYSTNSDFKVGLLSNSDWSAASWIWRSTSASDDYTYYRKSARLPAGTITRATVYVSSVQKYALYVNGTLVGKGPIYAFPSSSFTTPTTSRAWLRPAWPTSLRCSTTGSAADRGVWPPSAGF